MIRKPQSHQGNGRRGSARARTALFAAALLVPLLMPVVWAQPASAANLTATLVRTVNLAAVNPPIPDPSGVTYIPSRDRLLIADGEVDEMPIFQGSNLFETTRAGVLQDRGVTQPQTKEPVGVSYMSSNNHLLVADDDQQRVYEFDAGPDQRYGTADDSRPFFSTAAFGSTDPEDVVFFPPSGEIFVLEGSDHRVHRVSAGVNGVFDGVPPTGDDTAVEFDMLVYGIDDPEGIGYHSGRDTLLIVDFQTDRVYELNREMMLINVIDIAVTNQLKAAGITVAPATNDPSRLDLYIVDRGVDNDADPNENDGKLYELSVAFPPIPNLAPIATAGKDRSIEVGKPLALAGSVRDDGRPQPPGSVSGTWLRVSGPGTVSFGDPQSPQTSATFSETGTYTLRLIANDSVLTGSDDMVVTVVAVGAPIPLSIPIAKAFDDVEQPPTGYVDWLGTSLNIPNAGTKQQVIGLRFAGVDVPRGATITDAAIQFTSGTSKSVATSVLIRAVAADNTPTFSTAPGSVGIRPRTSASASWSPPAWTSGSAGAAQRTSQLRTLVKEVTDRAGWASGNAIAFIMTGSGERVARSVEAGAPAVLRVSYTSGDEPPPPPPPGEIAFRGGAKFYGNTTSATLTVPDTVQSGDGMLLFVSLNVTTTTLTPPSGWTQLADYLTGSQRTVVWRRVAASTDAGSTVRLGISGYTKTVLQLVAYGGTAPTNPVAAFSTRSDPATTASHPTPTVNVAGAGAWLVSYWADKSSTTTDWAPPGGVVVRDETIGSGGGLIAALLADSGGVVPIGTAGGLTATTNAASRAAEVSVVLAPAP